MKEKMMQEINLLTTLPARPKRYLMAEYLLFVIASWMFLLLLIYLVHFVLVSKKQTNLNNLISIKSSMVKNIIALNKESEIWQQNKGAVQHSRKDISAALVSFLAKQKSNKFSSYLTGLANTTPHGVWLKTIVFSNVDNDITLTGNTASAALIPRFLRNLNKSKAFVGRKFSTLHLAKNTQGNGEKFMEFKLTTKTGGTL
jgi:Tfp pilus assembly protein PilN